METVVVPVDESLDPHHALRTAFSLARRANMSVLIVSSCPSNQADEVDQSLRHAGARFGAVAPFSTRVLDGPPVDAVLESASAAQALVCMPTHGRAGVSRLVFGSVAEDLIRRSSDPVLCVGPDVTDIFLPEETIEGLVCTDDSAATDAVLDGAARFARRVDATCSVVQIVGPDEDISLDGGPPPRPIRDRAEQHCRDSAQRLSAYGVSATSQVLPAGHAAGSIVQHAQRNAFAFIVVGTVGRSGLARMTLGSVAAAVVRHAPCPVLVVPAAVPRPQHDRP
jgi:nucleotide-binding universal stress UspA family protein